MKTLLLPPIAPANIMWGKFHRGRGFIPPIGLMYIASYIRQKGYEVDILDPALDDIDEETLARIIREKKYDVVGISCFTNSARYTFKTAAIARSACPDSLIIIGGVHASVVPELTMRECPEADVVVIGEGELTFVELLDWKSKGNGSLENIQGIMFRDGETLKQTESRPAIADLDSLGLPAYDLLEIERYMPHPTQYKKSPSFPLLVTRGCPYLCTFCAATQIHGRRLRFRSLDSVFEELDLLVEKYGAKGIYIQDSLFTHKKKYLQEFCERLLSGGYKLSWMCNARVNQVDPDLLQLMKRSGCWQITFGLESASDDTLRLVKKSQNTNQARAAIEMVRNAGIQVMAAYILGFPGETPEDVEKTIAFAKSLATHTAIFFLPVPYPGTELVEQCRKYGGLRENAIWDDYCATDVSNPVYVNPLIGKEQSLSLYKKAYREYYTHPKVIVNNLKSIRSVEDVRRYGRALNAMLGLREYGLV